MSDIKPRQIGGWDAITLLTNAAAEKTDDNPDYVYERPENSQSCANLVEDDKGNLVGSCLVGRVYLNLGLKPDRSWMYGSAAYVAEGNLKPLGITFTPEAIFTLVTAQNLQDRGVPWRYAVGAAETALANLYHIRNEA